MNDQQGRKLPFSARQVVPGQLSYRQLNSPQLSYRQLSSPQLRRSRRRFVKGISLLVIASLLLLLVLEFDTHLNHHGQQPNGQQPNGQQPTLTRQVAFSSQAALIASQVDNLLTNKATHQQFSGSVLIAHDNQVLLRKGYSMADWGKQVPNTPHTKFYFDSTTKQLPPWQY